jgi:hypothetical protein
VKASTRFLAASITLFCTHANAEGPAQPQSNTQQQGNVVEEVQPNPHYEPKVLTQQPIIVLPPVADDRESMYRQATREESLLTPDEVRQFREYLLQKEQAVHQIKPPVMRSQSHSISLAPGSKIPKISIAPRYVASLVVVDSQGNPWPIVGHNNGAPSVFQTTVPQADPFNVLSIAALMNVGTSNLAIQLEGQSVPLIIQLEVNRDLMDVRADLVVGEVGPRSSQVYNFGGGMPSATPDSTMMAFIDGVPPRSAVSLSVSDARFRVWEFNDQLYIRTGLHVSSPRPNAISNGTGGVRVYRMNKTPMVLFSADGKVGTLRITLNDLRNERGRL